MANRSKKAGTRSENTEDTTRYGEFISSFDQWMTSDRQKKTARHLAEATGEISPETKKNGRTKKQQRQ